MENIEALRAIVEAEFRGKGELKAFEAELRAARLELEAFNRAKGAGGSNRSRARSEAAATAALAKAQGQAADARNAQAASEERYAAARRRTESAGTPNSREEVRRARELEAATQSRIRQEEQLEKAERSRSTSARDAAKAESLARDEALKRREIELNQSDRSSENSALRERQRIEAELSASSQQRFQQIQRTANLQGDTNRIQRDQLSIQRSLLDIDRAQSRLAQIDTGEVEKRRVEEQRIAQGRQAVNETIRKNVEDEAKLRRSLAQQEIADSRRLRAQEQQALRDLNAKSTARQRDSRETQRDTVARERAALAESRRIREQTIQLDAQARARRRLNELATQGTIGSQSALNPREQANLQRQIVELSEREARARADAANATPFQRQKARVDLLNREARVQKLVTDGAGRLRAAQDALRTSGQRWLGTLRGVVAGLAVYQGITLVARAATQAFAGALDFANQFELSERAVGGLLAGVVDVVDANGQLVTGSERFAELARVGREEIEALRLQAISTVAEFDKILPAFQRNVTAGVNAGLDLEEFRTVVTDITTAATLFGVAQTQLDEEIRSILNGTIRTRDSRVAVALNITNLEVNEAREAGRLYEFLRERFEGIRAVSEELSKTLPVVFSDIRDGALFALKDGITPFREELAATLIPIRDLNRETKGESFEGIGQAFREAIEPLSGIVSDLGTGFREFAVLGVLSIRLVLNAAETLTAFFASSFGQGFVQPFNVLLTGLNGILDLFQALTRASEGSFVKATGNLFGFLLVVRLIRGPLTTLGLAIRAAAAASVAFGSGLPLLGTLVTTITTGVRRLAAASLLLARRLVIPIGVFIALGIVLDKAIQRFDRLRGAINNVAELFGSTRFRVDQTSAPFLNGITSAFEAVGPQVKSVIDALFDTLGGNVDEGAEEVGGLVGASIIARVAESFGAAKLEQELARLGESTQQDIQLGGLSGGSQLSVDLASQALRIDNERQKFLEDNLRLQQNLRNELGEQETTLKRKREIGQQLVGLVTDERLAQRVASEALAQQVQLLTQAALLQERITLTQQRNANQELEALRGVSQNSFAISPEGDVLFAEQLQDLIAINRQFQDNNLEVERLNATAALTEQQFRDVSTALTLGVETRELADALIEPRQLALDQINAEVEGYRLQNELLLEQVALIERQNSVRQGLDNFVAGGQREFTGANNADRFLSSSFSDVRTGIEQGIGLALQGESIDIAAGAEALGGQIAANLGTALVEQAIFQPLFDFAAEGLGLEVISPGETAVQIALTANTAALALNTAALSAGASTEVVSGILGGAQTGSIGATGGMVGRLPIATFSQGGPSFSDLRPGTVRAPAMSSAPHNGDPRDRIPAFVRKDEYLATPEMNRSLGGQLYPWLERIRRGVHRIPRGLSLNSSQFGEARRVLGFASGGSGSSVAVASGSRQRRERVSSQSVIVLGSREAKRLFESRDSIYSHSQRRNARMARQVLS